MPASRPLGEGDVRTVDSVPFPDEAFYIVVADTEKQDKHEAYMAERGMGNEVAKHDGEERGGEEYWKYALREEPVDEVRFARYRTVVVVGRVYDECGHVMYESHEEYGEERVAPQI